MDTRYPAILTPEPDGGYLVQVDDFDEVFTEGDTLEETFFIATEALTLTLEGRIDERLPIPESSQVSGAHPIAPSARVQASLLVRRTRADRSFTGSGAHAGYLLAGSPTALGPASFAGPQAIGAGGGCVEKTGGDPDVDIQPDKARVIRSLIA